MAQSFTLQSGTIPPATTPGKPVVLVTGAAGNIGSAFAEHGRTKYDLRLMVRNAGDADDVDPIRSFGQVVEADLADLPRLKEICRGVDTIIHLAGDPEPNATWDSLLQANIVGTYNVMAAAKAANVRLVIHASSIHAVGGYGPTHPSHTAEAPNPGDLYGVTKCFGEALGRYMAEQEGLAVISLRIGAFQPQSALENKDAVSIADSWISPRDMNQMFDRCIAARHLRWGVFNALSGNAFNRLDISDARELLGYTPQDDAFKVVPGLAAYGFADKLMKHNLTDGFAKSGMRQDV